jgi:hypothetical protein
MKRSLTLWDRTQNREKQERKRGDHAKTEAWERK